jgi:phosphopantothenate-cysteine ligase
VTWANIKTRQPYSRHYTHATNCFLDFLTEGAAGGGVVARPEYAEKMLDVLRKYNEARDGNTLLMLPFVVRLTASLYPSH